MYGDTFFSVPQISVATSSTACEIQNSPFIFGLGIPITGLTVFSCDLDPTAEERKYVSHKNEHSWAELQEDVGKVNNHNMPTTLNSSSIC